MDVLNAVRKSLGLAKRGIEIQPFRNERKSVENHDSAHLAKAELIYGELLKLAQTL